MIGDMDLVRPLFLAGIRGAVVTQRWKPPRFSRFRRDAIDWVIDPWSEQELLVERLSAWAGRQKLPPVLFYQGDPELLMISRHRERLQEGFRFVVPSADLVEVLIDKARLGAVARTHDLPVPRAEVLAPGVSDLDLRALRFPVVVKPCRHMDELWRSVAGAAKALEVPDAGGLAELWGSLEARGATVMVQELIPGGETHVESYHVYIDDRRQIVAEFTGRKIRTLPRMFGESTAVTITDETDVKELGRKVTHALGLTGVAKADFKRDPEGRLWLLEINPRFNLWHHLGAVAGVNIPALVYADLTGTPRPPIGPVLIGARWCKPWKDVVAAREDDIPVHRWLRSIVGYEATSSFAFDDPLPMLGVAMRTVRDPLKRLVNRTKHR
ncbi:MAG: ATP-grasp domain-containing protein [Acidimicrobiia bacterium]